MNYEQLTMKYKMALIGFVFSYPKGRFIAISSFHIRLYTILLPPKIGFVFFKRTQEQKTYEHKSVSNYGFIVIFCLLPFHKIGFVFSNISLQIVLDLELSA
jgi:hypothetical protein